MNLTRENINSKTSQYFFPLIATLFLFLLKLYIEMMTLKDSLFTLHFDFTINDNEPLVKFNLSNMFDAYKVF